jgi:GNAT superfamily N-acetyltransferase
MVRIADMSREHVSAVADLHAQALSGDFLPSLGTPFLRVLYGGILDLDLGRGYVALDDRGVCGFVLGTFDSGALFKRLLWARGLRFGTAAIGAVLRRPRLLARLAETFLYPQKEQKLRVLPELMVIAVADGYRGQGIGGQLVQRLNDAFGQRGVTGYKVTVHQDKEESNRFYMRLGFEYRYTFQLYGKGWNLYTLDIPEVRKEPT